MADVVVAGDNTGKLTSLNSKESVVYEMTFYLPNETTASVSVCSSMLTTLLVTQLSFNRSNNRIFFLLPVKMP